MRSAVRVWVFLTVGTLLLGAANAEELRSYRADRANWAAQKLATSVHAALRRRNLYGEGGFRVGRVWDVRVADDRHTIFAVVTVRRQLGGGRVAIPAAHIRQVNKRLTIDETRQTIRSMPRFQGRDRDMRLRTRLRSRVRQLRDRQSSSISNAGAGHGPRPAVSGFFLDQSQVSPDGKPCPKWLA